MASTTLNMPRKETNKSLSVTDSKSSVSVADGEIAAVLFDADDFWAHLL